MTSRAYTYWGLIYNIVLNFYRQSQIQQVSTDVFLESPTEQQELVIAHVANWVKQIQLIGQQKSPSIMQQTQLDSA